MNRFAVSASLVVLVVLVMVAVVVPATVAKPTHPAHPAHPAHPSQGGSGGKDSCAARNEGYYGKGDLVSGDLAPGTKKDHYDGTLTVDVARANHRAETGSQAFTLTNARVRFGKGVSKSPLAAGDRVVLHGKITELPRGCSTKGFSPTITVRYVRITAANAVMH